MKVKAFKDSGYVPGKCPKCGQEERAVLVFEDWSMGVECVVCGDIVKVDEVEWM
jgi:ribosomal protein S27E